MGVEKESRERDQIRRIVNRQLQQTVFTEVDYEFLQKKIERLTILDKRIQENMLAECSEPDFNVVAYEKECDECDEILKKWLHLKIKFKTDSKPQKDNEKHNLKLPKIEINKFDDNPKSWLAFWGQFEKIHDDKLMAEEDKFQYLLQGMAEGSNARSIVASYPPTKENYVKVVDLLQTRYAKKEVLIEIYVRELLQLTKNGSNMSIDRLYDKIIVNLQILESLGINKEKYECMLLPMIESALPNDTLVAWSKIPLKNTSKLKQLLEYLKLEVEAEGRCKLARTSFSEKESVPTAACLVTKEVSKDNENRNNWNKEKKGEDFCFFCSKSHNSIECMKANNMTLDEKKDAVKRKGGCYICLKRGHMAKQCKTFIKCISCSKRHLIILCPNLHQVKTSQDSIKSEEKEKDEKKTEVSSNFTSNNTTTLLQTLIVKISGNKGESKVRALLDSGAQRTYVKTELAEKLGLQVVGNETLGHALFGGSQKAAQVHKLFKFKVSNIDNTYQTMMTGLEQEVLCGSLPKIQDPVLIQNLKKHNINLTDAREDISDISILIGSDYLGSILQGNFVHVTDSLVAINTKLGWTVQGPIQGIYNTTVSAHFVNTLPQNNSLEFLWNIETLGIKDPYEKDDLSESEILKNFNKNILVNEKGRYEVGLMWNVENPQPEPGYDQAYRRLLSTTRKLEKMNKLEGYHEVFEDWEKEEIIEMVQENNKEDGHYLPHHAVIKLESATTKIRPVFDASWTDKNKNSLNACIEKGPNLIEAIPKLLILFRTGTYGVISDIRKAFLQIAVSPPDRKYLKMLWWKDPNKKDEVITYQHARVPFGIACSPFLLAATINHHLEKHADTYPETAKKLKESFYVDNCVTSFDSKDEVEKFKNESIELMEKGKFDLRDWMTNSDTEEKPVSVLGIQWNRFTDNLCCNINLKTIPKEITKRDLLSITQQIFDPIGFLSPVTLLPKLILQKAWLLKTGWDEKIPEDLEKEYRDWIDSIDSINYCNLPRRLTNTIITNCKITIHVFCDASKDAFAGCVFLRAEYKKEVTVRLIMAKSRVAPIKRQMSLPRLELMGAVIASRLYKEISRSGLLSLCGNYVVYCWTDSAVVLAWLKRQGNWKTFVKNRVKEILANTNRECWNHLPGVYNPADLPSRGCSPKTLKETEWWAGPQWLLLEKEHWPKSQLLNIEKEEEIIASEQNKQTAVHVSTENFSNCLLFFNKYKKIVRLVARLLRMNPRIRKQYYKNSVHIENEEYMNAERTLMRLIQKEDYTDEKKKEIKFQTIEEDSVIKVKTRLQYSGEDKDFIHPILLSGRNEIVQRMVQEKHRELKHTGAQLLMTNLRNQFWITGIRKLTKKVVANCIICKRFKAKHYEVPIPPLPADRVGNTAAFEVTGIDLAGPLFLKNNQKVWIVLFTCAVYRAIHLELTESLSTDSFTLALRRFIARRGRTKIIYTDNGTNFVGTANLLGKINWEEVEETTSSYKIQWKFIPPASPWWGGWWERLVRVVKEILRRMLGKACVTWIELSTLLCDCEAVINSRPLTYIDTEDDTLRPLTPMMFLHGNSTADTPDLDKIDKENLNIRLKYLQKLREDFRSRFRNEYLSLMTNKGNNKKNEPRVGDIVLVETESSRVNWPLGIITEIFTGKDGCTRTAKVKTNHGEKVRSYQRLYPLELSAASPEDINNVPGSSDAVADNQLSQSTSSGNDVLMQDIFVPVPLPTTSRSGRKIKLPFRFLD